MTVKGSRSNNNLKVNHKIVDQNDKKQDIKEQQDNEEDIYEVEEILATRIRQVIRVF